MLQQLVPPNHVYVAVEGPIGVGKTTLARLLREELGGEVLLEVFEENPFLSDFYADRARYAFQTQIFFLLSRYRQQDEVVEQSLRRSSLFSDYIFAKDRLFAQLNLSGDELVVYDHVHAALSERIPVPSLVVHLQAATDVLMARIAARDRSYERSMSRQYIDDLRLAYERFFVDYNQAPVLQVDTTDINPVANAEDRRTVVGLVRNALVQGPSQPPLPQLQPLLGEMGRPPLPEEQRRSLDQYQHMHQILEQQPGAVPDVYLDFLSLVEEVGQVGRELKRLWIAQYQGASAAADAKEAARATLRAQLAEVLATLLKIANDSGIDVEDAYLRRMGVRHGQGFHL